MCATFPTHLTLLNMITLIILDEEYKLWSSSLCYFLQSSLASSLLGSYIFVFTLFSSTLNLCSYLGVRHQVLHPYKAAGKIIFCVSLIFTFLDRTRWQRYLEFNLSLVSFMVKAKLFLCLTKYHILKLLIYHCHFQILEPSTFKGFISYVYMIILSCVLLKGHEHTRQFSCVYF